LAIKLAVLFSLYGEGGRQGDCIAIDRDQLLGLLHLRDGRHHRSIHR